MKAYNQQEKIFYKAIKDIKNKNLLNASKILFNALTEICILDNADDKQEIVFLKTYNRDKLEKVRLCYESCPIYNWGILLTHYTTNKISKETEYGIDIDLYNKGF